MRPLRWIAQTRRHPSAILLAVQLAGMLLYPFIENTDAGRIGFGAFGVAVLVVTTGMVRRTPGLNWVSGGIALPAIVLLVLQAVFDMPQLLPWSAGLEAVFYFYAAASLIAYMMADRHATVDELFAAGATFTLLAWGFAYLFVLIQALQPGCFAAAVNPESPRTWTELMYLSFALLSSTGIGDVIPLTTHARMVAAVEMFVGVMYLAAVVSRLIGLTLIDHRSERAPPR
ncbi:MAG: ion channel [Pseudomonadota bacterium]